MRPAVVDVSDPAKYDIAEIFAYVGERSPQNAWMILDAFDEAFERLSRMPLIGHQRDDVDDETLRFWAVKSFQIGYRYRDDLLLVVRVIHGARDFTKVDWR